MKRALAVLVVGCAVPQTLGRWPDDAPTDVADVAASDTGKLARTYTTLAVGGGRSCAGSEGRVFCWGDPTGGGLGRDVVGSAAVARPTVVPGVTSADVIAMGEGHTCVVAQRRVFCWGDGARGQLGDGRRVARAAPGEVAGGLGALTLVAGRDVTCARDEVAWRCWGQLAGLTGATPSVLRGFEAATALAPGASHVCGAWRTATGRFRVRCAGDNYQGQLGDDVVGARAGLVDFLDEAGRPEVDALGVAVGTGGTCVVRGDRRTIHCRGEVAEGARAGRAWTLSSDVAGLSVGRAQVCAATLAGEVWCWGNNTAGQLGDGTRDSSDVPTRAALDPRLRFDDVRTDASHTCAREAGGRSLWCWGANRSGQLGAGSTEAVAGPARVLPP